MAELTGALAMAAVLRREFGMRELDRSVASEAAIPATRAHDELPTPAASKGVAATRNATIAPVRRSPLSERCSESWKDGSSARPVTAATRLGGRAPTSATTAADPTAMVRAAAAATTLATCRPSTGPASGLATIAVVARPTLA